MRPPARLAALATCLLSIGIVATAAGAQITGGNSGASVTRDQPTTTTAPSTSNGVQHLKFSYGPLDIEPGQNQIEISDGRLDQPKVDGWIVGFRPDLKLKDGTTPPVDQIHLHHGVWANDARDDRTSPQFPERFIAAGEEKTALELPDGYAYPYQRTDRWFLNYMIHNLTATPFKVSITYDVDFIPATSAAAKNLHAAYPVWLDVENGSLYPVFDVHKGSGTNGTFTFPSDDPNAYAGGAAKNQWVVDQPGVLIHTFGHLHPGGLRVDFALRRPSNGNATAHLFESTAKYYEPAGAVSWDVSMTATQPDWKVAVQPGDVLSISATYDTSRASWYESMGLGIVWMANQSGVGADPFTTKVDQAGELTHGHLPENDNHGGKKTTLKNPRLAKDGKPTQLLAMSNFLYSAGDLTAGGPIPTVAQGSSITFENQDADPLSVWHSVTSCKAPCTKSTGVAYPLADSDVQFDSGQLGDAGPPTTGELTWNTPADLAPGTYTYFCRVHPFMRGAFRVVVDTK
ncbi:MAG: hypothetical protein ABW073_04900 [Acidimicrobiia bacterium]